MAKSDLVRSLNKPMLNRLRQCAADTSSNWDGQITIYPPEARWLVALIDAALTEPVPQRCPHGHVDGKGCGPCSFDRAIPADSPQRDATTIHYQATDGATVTAGTLHTSSPVDLGEARRLAQQHAGDADVDLTAVYTPDGLDLIGEWEDTQAAPDGDEAP